MLAGNFRDDRDTGNGNRRKATGSWQLAVIALCFSGQLAGSESYSPYTQHGGYPTSVYWGDTHLHSSLSLDAYANGNRISPAEAYRFALGETVIASNGMSVRLRRPLDFLVIADHAEYLGVLTGLETRDPILAGTAGGSQMLRRLDEISGKQPTDPKRLEFYLQFQRELFSGKFPDLSTNPAFTRSIWKQVTEAADRYNDPGRFTAFIGYEWSSPGRVGKGNLHRVVIFKDGAEKANQAMPFSRLDSPDPEVLWEQLAEYEKKTGGEVLAIPHNGNLSNGEMFSFENFAGQLLSRSYAETRSRWEPLYEVTQVKGDSESHPFLSPTDEFAGYEIWNNWDGEDLPRDASLSKIEGQYARSGLKRGLAVQTQVGVNPFKFGMIGSTDAHTSLSTAEENNFWGKGSLTNPGPDRARGKLTMNLPLSLARQFNQSKNRAWQMASSGYAAVWATKNTREALFAAMKRKETYATTGPRMIVRFFGGWNYSREDARRPDLALTGYSKGVPMGGDLTNPPPGKAPSFLIRAVKDPDGANLDRVQLIKGWRDADGNLHEKVYDVALSGGRKVGSHDPVPRVGNTVNIRNATYSNDIGAPDLATVWTDPDFDREELSFYYLRVIEIPTPRWTAYDARFFGGKDIPPEVPMVTQERGYTSPIWYTPPSHLH